MKNKIWLASDGRWKTYVYDKYGRRKMVTRNSRLDLTNAVHNYYESREAQENTKGKVKARNDILEILFERFGTHRLSSTHLYGVFRGMRERCYCETSSKYCFYGARGIGICDEWMNSFDGVWKFMLWSIQNGYNAGLTIDRIDVNADYSPTNCRWVSLKVQANNKRNTKKYMCNGELLSLGEMSDLYNIPVRSLYWRIVEKGMNADMAISEN